MTDEEKKVKFWQLKRINLTDKYRLGVYNDTTYEQVFHFRLTGRGVVIVLVFSSILLIILTTLLIAFTPLREYIPGYPDSNTRKNIQTNALRLDSLQNEIDNWDQYLVNTTRILKGENPIMKQTKPDSSLKNTSFKDIRSSEDSLMRLEVESDDESNLTLSSTELKNKGLSGLYFFPPVKGEITNRFDSKNNHLGVDIVTAPGAVVVATLDGTVIFSEWTLDTGNVLQIQHDNNLISVYKHNAKLLKKQGSRVKAGDAIAIVGNSGEITTGPHLHFELWHRGNPLNPEQYIIF